MPSSFSQGSARQPSLAAIAAEEMSLLMSGCSSGLELLVVEVGYELERAPIRAQANSS
jgi:hypothetical protein